jgi:hypothetical protein
MVLVTPRARASSEGPAAKDPASAPTPYCVDRWEATLVDRETGTPITPYYPPNADRAKAFFRIWDQRKGTGTDLEKETPLPPLAAWETERLFEPKALSREGAVPQGYATGRDAQKACLNARKRLCTLDEWRIACRGEADRDFPYGERYEAGQCNVFGPAHPGILLWDDPTINHTDPRMNVVKFHGAPLLRRTGATKSCASRWGDDAIFDMVGNVDEWIDDPEGTFLGGFYARAKKDGCQSRVTSHGFEYGDYSTGIRCCRDADASYRTPTHL